MFASIYQYWAVSSLYTLPCLWTLLPQTLPRFWHKLL